MQPRTPPLADRRIRNQRNARFRTLGIPYKACNTCFAVKPLSAYNQDKAKPDGRCGRCRPCDREAASAWATVNAERKQERMREYRRANADRIAEYKREYYRANAERERERAREHQREHRQTDTGRAVNRAKKARRRARKLGAECDGHTWQDLLAAFEDADLFRCAYCDAPWEHVDHVMPLALGGGEVVGNLVPACAPCNLSKGARNPYEWLAAKYAGTPLADALNAAVRA